MKKLILTLMVVLMSMVASTQAVAKSSESEWKGNVPANVIVKQTTKFNDGRTLVVYFKKQGTNCEIYSPCNANDYSVDDASKVKSTNFEVVDKVEGKFYRKATLDEIARFYKTLVNQNF